MHTNKQLRVSSLDLQNYDNANFERGRSRLVEGAWILCKTFFFLSPLPLPSRIRVALLRLFGATVGTGVVIRSGVNITFPWRLTLGDFVWIGEEVIILSLADVRIASNCCVSQRAFLCTGSHDFRQPTFDLIAKPISVAEGCWIAAMSFIGPGVSLGAASMVTAGSVVSKSLPPGTVLRREKTSHLNVKEESSPVRSLRSDRKHLTAVPSTLSPPPVESMANSTSS